MKLYISLLFIDTERNGMHFNPRREFNPLNRAKYSFKKFNIYIYMNIVDIKQTVIKL